MRSAFHKGLNMYGEESEELAFDIHYWFKNAPFKREGFLGARNGYGNTSEVVPTPY